jgi:ABC-type nitrate/sulfonate/bicarbonate transport system permease component
MDMFTELFIAFLFGLLIGFVLALWIVVWDTNRWIRRK